MKSNVHDCIKCFTVKSVEVEQLMGDLLKEKLTPDFPLNYLGADICGLFFLKYKNQRRETSHTIYI